MTTSTIIDIAREAGVSFKTVSRVINGEPNVSAKTREKVQAVITRFNYRPNVWARALASSRSHLIGLIYDNPSQGYINQIQIGAMTACQRAGYHLVVEEVRCVGRNLDARIREFISTVQLDGAVLSPPCSDSRVMIAALKEAKIPFVRIAPYELLDEAPYVHMDDYGAAYEMTRYLLNMGHRDIAFIQGPRSHAAAAERHRGYLEAMKEQGGNLRPEWVVSGGFDARSGMAAGEELLATTSRPTAIFASNDDMAIGAMAAAFREGLTPPRDLSIVGFDDSPVASSLWPQLTTVRQPVIEMADAATEMLITRLRSPAEPGKRRVPQAQLLSYEIIDRESAQPLPGRQPTLKRKGVMP